MDGVELEVFEDMRSRLVRAEAEVAHLKAEREAVRQLVEECLGMSGIPHSLAVQFLVSELERLRGGEGDK